MNLPIVALLSLVLLHLSPSERAARAGAEKSVELCDIDDFPGFAEAWNETEGVLRAAQVPGLVLIVVSGSEADSYRVWSKTYGSPDLERPLVQFDVSGTRCAVGSISKSFASTLLGILLTEHATKYPLGWDTKVKDIMGDEVSLKASVEREITLRHLLSHTSGTFQYSPVLTMGMKKRPIQEYCRRMKFLDGTGELDKFHYNNLMYLLAECIIVKIGGDSFASLLKKKLFEPLGMWNSTLIGQPETVDFESIPRMYYRNNSNSVLVPMDMNLLNLAEDLLAAGGVLSTAADMARYTMFHLEGGRTLSGRELLRPALWNETHTSQVVVGRNSTLSLDYGMGWFLETFRADVVMSNHGGRIAGYDSKISLSLDRKFGIFTSANGPAYQSYRFQSVIHRVVYNLFHNDTLQVIWPSQADGFVPTNHSVPVDEPEPYQGTFGNGFFGNFTVTTGPGEGGQATLSFRHGQFGRGRLSPCSATNDTSFVSAMEGPLEHYHHTTGAESYMFHVIFADENPLGGYDTLLVSNHEVSATFRRGLRWHDPDPQGAGTPTPTRPTTAPPAEGSSKPSATGLTTALVTITCLLSRAS